MTDVPRGPTTEELRARVLGQSEPPSSRVWWSSTTAPAGAHSCNCIGCCRRCGTCRTWPGHTPAYCDLLVKQSAERAALLDKEKGERLGSPTRDEQPADYT